MKLEPPMYIVHPYSSLKNLGKKLCVIHGKIWYFHFKLPLTLPLGHEFEFL